MHEYAPQHNQNSQNTRIENTTFSKPSIETYRYLITTDCAEFFPPPEYNNEGAWPSWVDGFRLDDLEWWQIRETLDDSYFAEVYMQTLEQVLTVLANYGVLVADRNSTNIFLVPIKQDQEQISFVDHDGKWRVTQIDLGQVFDFSTEEVYFGVSPHRKNSGEIKDIEGAKKLLAEFLKTIAFDLLGFVKKNDGDQQHIDEKTKHLYEQMAYAIQRFARDIDGFFDKKRVLFSKRWVINKDQVDDLIWRLNSLLEQYHEKSNHKNIDWGTTSNHLRTAQKLRTFIDDL